MPAGQQIDPPEMEHIAPKWFQGWVRKLLDWLIANRVVAGFGIYITDAPGGGAMIACNIRAVTQAAASTSGKLAFYWYPSPYTGGGEPPENQGLKIRLRPGRINGGVDPSNMGSEFTLANDATTYLTLTLTNNADGFPVTAVLATSDTPPGDDPAGSLNVAPATSTRTLWTFVTEDNKITDDTAGRVGDLDVLPFAYKLACGGAYVRIFWGAPSPL